MIRVIPRLDIKGPNLVKGVHLEGLRALGKPADFARYYYQSGADEIFFVDTVASLYCRNSLVDIIQRTSKEIFVPMTVGGGLRSVGDIETVLRAGADKVTVNTAAIRRPALIREAAWEFGSSTIIVSIEAQEKGGGKYEVYTDYGREPTGVDALEWALRVVELGAGEIMVTSIDRDGTGKGFDIELTRKIAEAVPIPVIASGGAGNLSHVVEVILQGRADAVSLASMLHYGVIHYCQYEDSDFREEGNIEFLRQDEGRYTIIEPHSLGEIKERLEQCGIECRRLEGSTN